VRGDFSHYFAMKCLLVSDLHYDLRELDWVVSVASQFDVVIMAGDQIDGRSHVYMRVQIPVIMKYLELIQAQTQLLVCSGNHDLNVRGPLGERIARWMEPVRESGIVTDGDSIKIGNILFTVYPWWDGPKTREIVAAQMAADAEKPKEHWIWVYHGPPDNSPTSWSGTRHYGDSDLVTWIEQHQPDIVMSGHIHEAPFVDQGSWVDKIGSTWIFNSGREKGPYPPHVVFNIPEKTAVWCSQKDRQLVALNEPLQRPPRTAEATPDWLKYSAD
jgi:Icc-related predicted phosphoesterase